MTQAQMGFSAGATWAYREDGGAEQEDAHIRRVIRQAQAGDLDAHADLFRNYYSRVLGNHLRTVGRLHDSEDLTALTFLTMYTRLASFELRPGPTGAMFGRWLFDIAKYIRLDYFGRGRQVPTEERAVGGTGVRRSAWHRIASLNKEARTGVCSQCGPTNVRVHYSKTAKGPYVSYVCGTKSRAKGRAGQDRVSNQRRAFRKKGLPLPEELEPHGRPSRVQSVSAVPVSPEWVKARVVDVVSDFHGAPDDHPVWAALDRAVRRA